MSRLQSTCVTMIVFRGNNFGGKPIRTEVEARVRKLKNGKTGGKDEVIRE